MSPLPTHLVTGIEPDPRSPSQISREFRSLLDSGTELRCAGDARKDPRRLLSLGYSPKARIDLFDTTFYLSNPRQNPDLRFFVAYVVQKRPGKKGPLAHARLFYKDISLVWRVASHLIDTDGQLWVGKGDVRGTTDGEWESFHSVESTTDLPLEIQAAVESLNRRATSVAQDKRALRLVIRRAPLHRVEPYRDFSEPRRRVAENPRNLIHGGKEVISFRRQNDPSSLRIVRGYEPDFREGIVERLSFGSSLYGGTIHRYRVLSTNRRIQYLFDRAPKHAWMIPPQALTTELSSYGVRTVDVVVDEDAFVPGYEYHFLDDTVDPPVLHSQIPEGFVGDVSPSDESRYDASAWLDRLPVIQEFRRLVRS